MSPLLTLLAQSSRNREDRPRAVVKERWGSCRPVRAHFMSPQATRPAKRAAANGAYQAGVWTGRVFAIVFLSLLVHKLFFAKKKK